MIFWAITALLVGGTLVGLNVGRAFGRWEMTDLLDRETWRANCWKKRCEQLEQQDHVRIIDVNQHLHVPERERR